MTALLQEIISILVAGISQLAAGIGSGLGALVKEIFVTTSEAGAVTGLSTFGGLIVVFAGVSLAIGLSRWVVNWLTSLGSSN